MITCYFFSEKNIMLLGYYSHRKFCLSGSTEFRDISLKEVLELKWFVYILEVEHKPMSGLYLA